VTRIWDRVRSHTAPVVHVALEVVLVAMSCAAHGRDLWAQMHGPPAE
jgi:hypothetical protein